jgi:hypothetical protein
MRPLCPTCKSLSEPLPFKQCRPCRREYAKAHYQKYKAIYRRRQLRWGKENAERLRELRRENSRAWKKNNRQKVNESQRRLYASDPVRYRAIRHKWRIENREKHLEWRRLYNSKVFYGEFAEAHRTFLCLKRALTQKEK